MLRVIFAVSLKHLAEFPVLSLSFPSENAHSLGERRRRKKRKGWEIGRIGNIDKHLSGRIMRRRSKRVVKRKEKIKKRFFLLVFHSFKTGKLCKVILDTIWIWIIHIDLEIFTIWLNDKYIEVFPFANTVDVTQ